MRKQQRFLSRSNVWAFVFRSARDRQRAALADDDAAADAGDADDAEEEGAADDAADAAAAADADALDPNIVRLHVRSLFSGIS